MKLVEFNANPSLEEALSALDGLRKDVESGKVVAFAVAAVSPEDATLWYCGSARPVSRLRLIGAMSNALHHFNMGD
jgi:hypothetical protein